MIRVMTVADRLRCPELFEEMHRARAVVFRERLGWDVAVTRGLEIDHYDRFEDPIYVIAYTESGQMTGSLRLLPTTGETMLRNEFADFFSDSINISAPTAWECTRFCVHPRAETWQDNGRRVSSELLIGLCEFALQSGITHIVGLYDRRMPRVYRRIGWEPEPLAVSRPEVGHLIVGIWDVSQHALAAMKIRKNQDPGAGGGQKAA
jgi:N-acyl-L-homoserine lactone synthetase